MQLTIEVLYSCPDCGLVDVPVKVPARGVEDVGEWMEATVVLVGNDHFCRSPSCEPEKLRDLKIPMAGTDRIGGAPVN